MLKHRLLAASAASYTIRGAFPHPSRRLNTCNYNSCARIVNCHREFRIRCVALHTRFCSFPHVGHVNRMLVRRTYILLARIYVSERGTQSNLRIRKLRKGCVIYATNKKRIDILKFKLYIIYSLIN